jgi:hypothetical protein
MYKRLLSALGVAVVPLGAALIALPGVASADDLATITVVRSTTPLTTADTLNGLTFYHQVGMTDVNPETGSVAVVDGPGTPPLGTGSLQLSTGSNGDTGVALFDQSYLNYYFDTDFDPVIPFPVVYNPAALFLKFGYHDTATDLPVKVMITLWRGASPINFEKALPTGAAWQTFDIATDELLEVGGDGTTTKTLADWAQPGDSLFSVFVGADYNATNDNPNKSFNVDDLTYGFGVSLGLPSPHPPARFDFENGGGPTLTPSPATTIKAGKSTKLTVNVNDGADVSGAHMQLLAKPYGASGFTKIATADTDADGNAKATVAPLHNTLYRWRYMGTDTAPENPGVDAANRLIGVKEAVSVEMNDPDLTTSQKVKLHGVTLPVKANTKLTVFRIKSGQQHKFGEVTTGKNGTYAFTHDAVSKGTYRLRVAYPAGTGNLAGVSRTVTETVG